MPRIPKSYWVLLIPTFFFLSLVLTAGSFFLMKKVVVFLCLPAGLVWVLLTYAIFWPRLALPGRVFLIITWGLYTLAGNPLLGNRLLHVLEKPYANLEETEVPFDIVFVLGGGTGLRLNGEAQIGSAGDRVITAARLYRKGKVTLLAASGRSVTEVGQDRDLSDETVTIWKELGIPESDTIRFPAPRNTGEEIEAYLQYLNEQAEQPKRIGVCTSAWHLKRAEKLWKRKGLNAIPVPADFRSRPIPVISTYFIPKKRGFSHVQIALWEFLGIWLD